MSAQYQAVSLVEKQTWEDDYPESTDSDRECQPLEERSSLWGQLKSYTPWLLHVLFFSVSLSMLLSSQTGSDRTLSYVKKYSAWSPAREAVEYQSVRYNVTTEGNRFVGKGPEVDLAWMEISYDLGDQMITPAQLAALGMPETSIKVTDPKTGEEGYRVGLEVFHQLHCLNVLRKTTFKEYYQKEGILGSDEELAHHTAHCIEVLRLNLMCQADIGVFTLYLKEGDPLAWPELNSQHMCRNFDKIRDWARDHSVGIMVNG